MAMMAQPFAHSGGMATHPGMPHGGHPMAAGHPSNQALPGSGQPGVSMGQQIHAGMAGVPGTSQVTQGGQIMAGMPQGSGPPGVSTGGPSAHALSHLNPGNPQQIYTQQQQQQMQQASKSFNSVFEIVSSLVVSSLCLVSSFPNVQAL